MNGGGTSDMQVALHAQRTGHIERASDASAAPLGRDVHADARRHGKAATDQRKNRRPLHDSRRFSDRFTALA
jgi:hypothetical protein